MICFCLLRKFLGGRHDQFIRIIRMLRLQRFRLDGCAAFRRAGSARLTGLMGVTGWPVKGLKAANDTGKGSR